jgi:5-hydroxyisourate hydrolase
MPAPQWRFWRAARATVGSEAFMGISTHVLDIAWGRPAGGVAVVLERRRAGGGYERLGAATTGPDGRARLVEEKPAPGSYRIGFASGAYFERHNVAGFYPEIHVEFVVSEEGGDHFHVPLLLSPFGYSTYRGA